VAISYQRVVRNSRRCSHHMHTKLAASRPITNTNQPGASEVSSGHAEKLEMRLGATM
jgi:hypothetical protein